MPAGVWKALAGLIAVLAVAVVALDQWQVAPGPDAACSSEPGASRRGSPARPCRQRPAAAGAGGGERAPRAALAIIVDDLGSRRDVFDLVRDIGRPLAVGVLPGSAAVGVDRRRKPPGWAWRSCWISRWSRIGIPELDPGPGAL